MFFRIVFPVFFAVPFFKSKSHLIVLFSIEELIFKNK
jgi:hypothetical protein